MPRAAWAGVAIERLELEEDTARRVEGGLLALFIGGSLLL